MIRHVLCITYGTTQRMSSTRMVRLPAIEKPRLFHISSFLNEEQNSPLAVKERSPPPAAKEEKLTSVVTPSEGNSAATEELDTLYKTIELEMKAYEPAVLKSYSWFTETAAKELGIEIGKCWAEKKPDHDRYTLLKSIHVYKKHRVQYEVRTYHRFARFHKLTSSTADTFLEYIERNLPEGIGLKVTKVAIERLPDHVKPPSVAQLEQ